MSFFKQHGIDNNFERANSKAHSFLKRLCMAELSELKLEHWCADCDSRIVKSDDPSTGTFYQVFGHQWRGIEEERMVDGSGDYHSVIFALCSDCDDKE